jgi:hypothetical protein
MRHDKVSQITAREAILVGPEGVFKLLISLSFSWAEIGNLPASFRMVPRLLNRRISVSLSP